MSHETVTYPFELPSGRKVEVRELTGLEEEILSNARLLRTGDAVNQVLRNCIVSLDDAEPTAQDILDMLGGDRQFVVVRLRQVSLGSEVELELVCNNPDCGGKTYVTVDLDERESKPFPAEREFTVTLPVSGDTVTFVHFDGHMEKRLHLMAQEEVNVTTVMLMRTKAVNEKPPSKKYFSSLSLRDRTFLREEMRKVDGGIDTSVETVCRHCGTPIATKLEGNKGFFFPGLR